MSGNWKQIIQEKAIEAAVITAFNFVPGLAAKGITLARNGIERVFGGRNEAESDWVGDIGGVAEKTENLLGEYERKSVKLLMSWVGIDPIASKKRRRLDRQKWTSTVAELGGIGEFFPGAGDPRASRKRKERGYDDLIIMPSRGLEEDPQRFCTCKYGDDGRFTLIYSTTSPQFKWTYPRTDGSGLPSAVVSSNDVAGGRGRWFTFKVGHGEFGMYSAARHGRVRRKIIKIVHILPRSYLFTVEVDAWADSSSRRWTFAFSVLPLPFDFVEHKFLERARKFCESKGWDFSLSPRPTLDSYALPLNVFIEC